MTTALIGYTGFVGSSLRRQFPFDDLYHSQNIAAIRGKSYDLIACAGISAVKWKANQQPDQDWQAIQRLLEPLQEVDARVFLLISTIDVYPRPVAVDENASINPDQAEPYGRHRYLVEEFVSGRFPIACIVRLPGLFGAGLKKNFIFDLLHNPDALPLTDSRSIFQFYDLDNLWRDISVALDHHRSLVNFAVDPVSAAEAAEFAFNIEFTNILDKPPAYYDMHTCFAADYGLPGHYLQSKAEVLGRLRTFVQQEKADGSQ